MDPSGSQGQAGKPSGIPRLSRLPVPASTVTKVQSRTQLKTAAPVVERTRTSSTTATGSLPRARVPVTSHRSASNPKAAAALSAATSVVFKKPVGRPTPQQSKPRPRQVEPSNIQGEDAHEDQLGHLDGFIPSSRVSSRQGYRGEDAVQLNAPSTPDSKKPCSSLSDRTIESLAQTPSSRRRSSFFVPESPMGPPPIPRSRPASALGDRLPCVGFGVNKVDVNPRPTTASRPNPSVRRTSLALRPLPKMTATPTSVPRALSPTKASVMRAAERPPSEASNVKRAAKGPLVGSKTFSGRTSGINSRPTLTGVFNEPEDKPTRPTGPSSRPNKTTPAKRVLAGQQTSPATKSPPNPSKSSAALREQIRKAKAERKSLSAQQDASSAAGFVDTDISEHHDPFNQQPKNLVLRKKVESARADGRLNIAAMGLKCIPEEVLKMYDYEHNKESSASWAEVVDLTRFVAADNEIEELQESVFPDTLPDDLGNDDEVAGPQFSGVEFLDLHGNLLSAIPVGLRRLERLTVLNLSRNRLTNDALGTISQITSLKDLKLSDNSLSGGLSPSVQTLRGLEVLELQGNKLTSLPDELRALTHLRVLNVSQNSLASLPMTSLTPVIELYASKNNLRGTLFSPAVLGMIRLQILDVSVNQLSSMTNDIAMPDLPELRTLNVAFNRIAALPDVATCPNLTTLFAEDNNISTLPDGFIELRHLKAADFTGNAFNRLDERVALMDALESFKIQANPLRERKFLTMPTDDLKNDLRARLAPPAHVAGSGPGAAG